MHTARIRSRVLLMVESKKRGQVTVYIVLGLIILIVLLLLFFFRSKAVTVSEEQRRVVVEDTPAAAMPAREFVEGCLRRIGKDAITSIGMHGGYAMIGSSPEALSYTIDPLVPDETNLFPTEAAALYVTDTKTWAVPYWWHMKSPNRLDNAYQFSIEQPPLGQDSTNPGDTSIRSQIERYVASHLGDCLRGFSALQEQNVMVTPQQEPTVSVDILSDNVFIMLTYPLTVEAGGGRHELSTFMHPFDVSLPTVYALANDIAIAQANQGFLEQGIMTAIGVNAINSDEDSLPPLSGAGLSFTPPMWQTTQVRQKIEQLLAQNIPTMQVLNTKGAGPAIIENDAGEIDLLTSQLYNRGKLLLPNRYHDLSVGFNYFNWPIYFKATDGEIITAREDVTVPILSLVLPIQRYDTPYDISFPVMVKIRDDDAFDGEGFDFYFALEGNVRNNERVTTESAFASIPPTPIENLLCDMRQRTSGDYTITVKDKRTGQLLDNAIIKFSSSGTVCGIGRTGEATATAPGEYSSPTGAAASFRPPTMMVGETFVGNFPQGALGELVVDRMGYETVVKPFMPDAEGGSTVVELYPIREMPFRLVKRDIIYDEHYHGKNAGSSSGTMPSTCGNGLVEAGEGCDDGNAFVGDLCAPDCQFPEIPRQWKLNTGEPASLAPNEEAMIILEKIKESEFEMPFLQVIHVYDEGDLVQDSVKLLPGEYIMTAMLIGHDLNWKIPERYFCAIGDYVEIAGYGINPTCNNPDGKGKSNEMILAGSGSAGAQLPSLAELRDQGIDLTGQLTPEQEAAYESIVNGETDAMPGQDDNVFLLGNYKSKITISSSIYQNNRELVIPLLKFNLASKPEEDRLMEDISVLGHYDDYVQEYPSRFRPNVQVIGAAS